LSIHRSRKEKLRKKTEWPVQGNAEYEPQKQKHTKKIQEKKLLPRKKQRGKRIFIRKVKKYNIRDAWKGGERTKRPGKKTREYK